MDGQSLYLLFLVVIAVVMANTPLDLAGEQVVLFKKKHPQPIGVMTTGTGKPIDQHEVTSTLNENLLNNDYFLESILHFSRERIPERVVHTKGTGAFGFFEVTHNVSHICKAKLFSSVGKRTPIATRFSLVASDKGGADTARDVRGFAVKFYTEEGNWDLVGLSIPIFSLKDPLFFPSFVHAIKRNPATNLMDRNTFWDVFTLHPESLYTLLFTFGDRGIPDGYRHMPGYSIHTYQVVNDNGESFFIKLKFSPDAGLKNILSERANHLAAKEPDYFVKDLYNAIAEGKYPSWTCYAQILSKNDVMNAGFDVFDITRILPEDIYPPIRIGRMVLNRNPVNFFAEIEQLAFCPRNLVPGILGAPDKMFEARRLSYKDGHNYRLRGNPSNIPVNCPIRRKYTYNRDGEPPVNDNQRDAPNYYPNSFNGPIAYNEKNKTKLIEIVQSPPYNLDQCRSLYYSYSSDEKKRLIENIVASLKMATKFLQERAVVMFGSIDNELSEKLRCALRANSTCNSD